MLAGPFQADLDSAAFFVDADKLDVATIGTEHGPDIIEDSADSGCQVVGVVGHDLEQAGEGEASQAELPSCLSDNTQSSRQAFESFCQFLPRAHRKPLSMPTGSLPLLEAQGLGKTYKGRRGDATVAVQGLSMQCFEGEVFGLLGPNGAGKTTTLRMLSTVLSPTEGSARIAGHDVVEQPHEERASIGFLSGNTGLYPRLTPREVLTYFGRLHGMDDSRITRRIDEFAEMFDMGEFLDKRCDALSSGMRQKVNVARTALHDPRVLILDEPTVGLDVLASRTIVEFVRRCRDEGRCVIFSTHIMGEVARLCDRLAIIHQGRLQFLGTLDELREQSGQDIEEAFVHVLEQST